MVDCLRSCYSTQIYSFDPVTGVNVPTVINWYVAPAHSAWIAVHHQYASSVWTRPTAYSEQVGEILTAAKTYSKGTTATGVIGDNFCGESWTGKLERLTTPIPSAPSGQPACCTPPPLPCASCVEGSGPSTMYVIASGGTGDFAVCNGIWPCVTDTACRWLKLGSPPNFRIEADLFPPNWGITVTVPGAGARWVGTPTLRCRGRVAWGVGSVDFGTGTPPIITTQPIP